MARIYTIVNQKGGVGKTTTAINLGAYLGYYGQRVLLVDIDPQANATSSLGIDKATMRSGSYETLIRSTAIGDHVAAGMMFSAAARLRRRSSCGTSASLWSLV